MNTTNLFAKGSRLLLMAASLALGAFVDVAHAELRFCNHTDQSVDVAIAYVQRDDPGTTTNGHRGIVAEGWWGVAPGECSSVKAMNVGNHNVWYFAQGGGRTWKGDHLFCVPSDVFTVAVTHRDTSEVCSRGRRMRGFRPIEGDHQSRTVNLTP